MISFYAICLLWGAMAHLSAPQRPSTVRFVSVNVGEEVTLECFCQKDSRAMMFYWYKQTLGQKPELVSTYYKHEGNGTFNDDFKTNPRFQLETSRGKNHLRISKVQMSDSATYYCISCCLYECEYVEDIIIQVEGSGLNFQALVEQSASETIQPGDAVTLSCTVHTGTCDEEPSVYWFKDEEESHPGLIYNHGGRNDQCERKPNTQTLTCVYNLPLKSLKLADVGTYYCAVASCGRILFGNGTKLDFEEEAGSLVLVYVLSGALGFNTILAVLVAYKAYAMCKTKSCKCAATQETSSAASAPNAEDFQDEDNLHYAALRKNKVNRSRRIKDDNLSECVYSSVRQ